MTSLTRRALLARVGAAAAVAGVAGAWSPGSSRPGTSGDSPALSIERREHYRRLVAAVTALEGGRASLGYLRSSTTAFSGWYSRNAGLRPMADEVLDEVGAAGGARRLLTHVHADADPRPDKPFGTRGNRRRILAGEALLMARPPFAPDRG